MSQDPLAKFKEYSPSVDQVQHDCSPCCAEGYQSLAELSECIINMPMTNLGKDKENIPLREASLGDFARLFERFSHSEAMIKAFFGKESSKNKEAFKPIYEHNLLQYSMKQLFADEGYEKISDMLGEYGETEALTTDVQCGIDEYFEAYNNAVVFFYNKKTKGKIVVKMEFSFHQNGVHYYICHNDAANYLWKKWCDYSKENNFYKGKKIDAACNFLAINPDMNWDSVILSEKTRTAIKKNIENIFKHRKILEKNGVKTKRGVIFEGDPGVGKTLICKVLANTIDVSVVYVLPSHISGIPDIHNICEMARDIAPTLMVIEDIDWVAQDRELHGFSGATVELMNKLDGIEDFNGVVTVATTNKCDTVEAAIKNRPGRFDRVIKVNPPDHDGRIKMLEEFLKRFKLGKDVSLTETADKCKNMSGAYLCNLCETAAVIAVDDNSFNKKNEILILQKHLIEAYREIKDKDFTQLSNNEPKRNMGFRAPNGLIDNDW